MEKKTFTENEIYNIIDEEINDMFLNVLWGHILECKMSEFDGLLHMTTSHYPHDLRHNIMKRLFPEVYNETI